jgi:hypothetical protein
VSKATIEALKSLRIAFQGERHNMKDTLGPDPYAEGFCAAIVFCEKAVTNRIRAAKKGAKKK